MKLKRKSQQFRSEPPWNGMPRGGVLVCWEDALQMSAIDFGGGYQLISDSEAKRPITGRNWHMAAGSMI